MRIARILTRLNLGGPARQALASDPLLAARGHELGLFVGRPEPGEGDLFEAFRGRGLAPVRIDALRRGVSPVRDLAARRQLRRELERFRPDVVHTHASKAGALGRSALGKGTLRDVARVHTFHGHVLEGYFPAAVSRRLIAIERRLARETDRVLAVSHATADDLLRLGVVAEERLVVVPPGVELRELLALERSRRPPGDELRARLGLAPEGILVGVVGRLAEVKQPERALEVFLRVAGRYPAAQLVFVGDGELRGVLERRIGALEPGLRERVHMLGAVAEMVAVWAELDLVLSCSRAEGLPVALIEAGAAGLPAVARQVGGVEEVLVHERTGRLGASDEELAFGLAELLAAPDERRAMGQRARLRVARQHSAEALAERLEAVYETVLAERRAARTGAS